MAAETPSGVRQEAFFGDQPPVRTIGSECEYLVTPLSGTKAPELTGIIRYSTLEAAGMVGHINNVSDVWDIYLANGSRLYLDAYDQFLEYATPESAGPLEAALTDAAGSKVVKTILAASGLAHGNIYRRSGYDVGGDKKPQSAGFHENYLIPYDLTEYPLLAEVWAAHAGSKIWAGAGMAATDGFRWIQKSDAIGSVSDQGDDNKFLVNHGMKPMVIVQSLFEHNKLEGDQEEDYSSGLGWHRLENRYADPTMSPLSRYVAFGAGSLVLRVLEHRSMINFKFERVVPYHIVGAAMSFSADPTLHQATTMIGGGSATALDIDEQFITAALELKDRVKLPHDERLALELWQRIHTAFRQLQADPSQLVTAAHWSYGAAKLAYLQGHYGDDISNQNPRAVQRDMLWDIIDGDGGRRAQNGIGQSEFKSMLSKTAIDRYVKSPPSTTRAARRVAEITNVTSNDRVEHVDWGTVVRQKKVDGYFEPSFVTFEPI